MGTIRSEPMHSFSGAWREDRASAAGDAWGETHPLSGIDACLARVAFAALRADIPTKGCAPALTEVGTINGNNR